MSAFVYKVAKFISWPQFTATPNAQDHFDVCVADNFSFAQSFKKAVKNRLISGYSIHVENIALESDLQHCNLLYFHSDQPEIIKSFLIKAEGKPILTIATSQYFIKQGGMVLLDRSKNKISLHINNDKAKQEGLSISAHLLRLNKEK